MTKKETEEVAGTQPAVTNRWWVDLGGTEKVRAKRPPGPVGSRFFHAGIGFEQERARDCLTDNNLKLLREADPPEGGWGYVRLGDDSYPERELERIKKLIALPAYARGVIIDCGRSVRVLVTATPAGDRLLELALGEAPSFDSWVHDEWICERVFSDADEAIAALRDYIREYLSPDGIARAEAIAARA